MTNAQYLIKDKIIKFRKQIAINYKHPNKFQRTFIRTGQKEKLVTITTHVTF